MGDSWHLPWWTFPDRIPEYPQSRRAVTGAFTRDQAAAPLWPWANSRSGERAVTSGASQACSVAESAAATTQTVDDFLRLMTALSVRAEAIGGHAAEALLTIGLPYELRAGVVRAMWDEIRHAEAFLTLSQEFGTADLTELTGPAETLMATLRSAESPLEFAVLHTELEALALDTFEVLYNGLGATRLGALYRAVSIDEASHLALGWRIVEHLVAKGAVYDDKRVKDMLELATSQTVQGDVDSLRRLCDAVGADSVRVGPLLQRKRRVRAERLHQLSSA